MDFIWRYTKKWQKVKCLKAGRPKPQFVHPSIRPAQPDGGLGRRHCSFDPGGAASAPARRGREERRPDELQDPGHAEAVSLYVNHDFVCYVLSQREEVVVELERGGPQGVRRFAQVGVARGETSNFHMVFGLAMVED
uniref:Uncharacterized protein n=1 Tax=Oryza brachyantha TaxID=4533 RepID=J3NDY0_ORYBR